MSKNIKRRTDEDNMNVEDLMKYMLSLFDNISKELSAEYEKLSQKDMELNDLDHYIENNKLKSNDLAKVGKLRKILRKERREIKNNIDYLEVIKRFTDKHNNRLITGDIIQNLKEQEKLRKKQQKPIYRYRTSILERLGAKKDEDISNRPTEM